MIAATMAVALAGTGAEVLQPSTGWNVDYAENSCTLSRSFGTGDGTVSLGLIPQTGGTRAKIVLMAKDPQRFAGRGRAFLAVGEGARIETDYYSLLDPQIGRVAMVTALRSDWVGLDQAKTLTVTLRDTTLVLAIPQIAPALKALEGCETDLLKGWGVDPFAIAEKPKPIGPGKWLTASDYPLKAVFENMSGITEFRVTIDAAGKTTGCLVTLTSGVPELDGRACEVLMKRSRFEPARDKDGKPVPSIWASAIRWQGTGR